MYTIQRDTERNLWQVKEKASGAIQSTWPKFNQASQIARDLNRYGAKLGASIRLNTKKVI